MFRKRKDISSLTDEALIRKRKTARYVLRALGIVLVTYIAYFIYLIASDGSTLNKQARFLLLFGALPILFIPAWQTLATINAEIKRRARDQEA
jgi:hypothetical protein